MALRAVLVVCLLCVSPAWAEDRQARLHAPQGLIDSGLLDYILPRFTLKTQVRVELVPPGDADLLLGDAGAPLFEGAGQVWALDRAGDDPDAVRLADWLTSDVGRRTVLAFAPDGTPLFTVPEDKGPEVAALSFTGDPKLGHEVALAKCTRCHAVDENTIWSSIGSTPSFAALRSMPDWQERFTSFYVLNPHPAVTIVKDVTLPFDEGRPPPIPPVELTLDEVDAVLAYVAGLEAADLGAPIDHQ